MRSGPKAILYQSTLFRTSELAWVKVAPLSVPREVIRWSLIACGLAFFLSVASAKDSYKNLEGLLGLLAWHVGYWLQPDNRLASSGDLQESYEARGGSGSPKTFRQWVGALSEGPNECKLRSPRYEYWFNLDRVSWASPCIMADFYPLVLVPVFMGYRWLIAQGYDLTRHATILADINLLSFQEGTGTVSLLCLLISLLGVAACVTSVGPGVLVRASGGLSDRFAMTSADRNAFFEKLAGNSLAESQPSQKEAAPAASRPAEPLAPPAPSPKPAEPAPKPAEPAPLAPAPEA